MAVDPPPPPRLTDLDRERLDRVHRLALAAEAEGNLPIAALLVRGAEVLAEAANRTLEPRFHPGLHAEVEALRRAPAGVWERGGELTLYTSLEPCLMCFGALVLHRVGRVVYGAADPLGGALSVLPHLPAYVRAKAEAIRWVGPALPDTFDPLARRALERGAARRDGGA